MEKIMWKSRLKCGHLCKNKIVTMFFTSFFIPQNGTCLKNTPRIFQQKCENLQDIRTSKDISQWDWEATK